MKKSTFIKKLKAKISFDKHVPIIAVTILILIAGTFFSYNKITYLQSLVNSIAQEKDQNYDELMSIATELEELKNVDQIKRNDDLEEEIGNIQTTYKIAVATYDKLVDFRSKGNDTDDLEEELAEAISKLSEKDYSGAEDTLTSIGSKISQKQAEIAATFSIPETVPVNNSPPGSGYSRQSVSVDGLGSYMVSLVAADIGSTRVIVDTAADSDCGNDCPVLPLAEFISRNGAYAGINGSYFCPASYASCAGKTNSFDLLAMNSKKTYFNSDNNVYSSNPVVIFGDGYVRFVGSGAEWGRDTSPNGVLMNYPLLVFNGQVRFGGDDDPKKGSRGGRSFVAQKGNTVYIGVVHSATVAESARVLQALGMENAMNLDNGGSTALWSGGYKVGPGRNLPNVILFVGK